MTKGFPTYNKLTRPGDKGVDIVSRIFNDDFGWLFKRNHQEHDFGIDAQVDVVLEGGAVTGQMLALQIKHGSSFFSEKNRWGYVYRGEEKHFNYLANYPIPVLIVLCHPSSNDCYWAVFDPAQTLKAGSNWKITVPFENKLKTSKANIERFLPPLSDCLSDIQSYWELNELLVSHHQFYFILARDEIESLNVTRVRAFFDRIRCSREIAMHCQGRVEIGFHGYDSDARELFEVPEVRRFVPALVSALPELFFFAYTGERGHMLKTIALCLTEVKKLSNTVNEKNKITVEVATDKIGQFLESHFPGLNEMTEWLSMPIEENKRISFDVARALGFKAPPEDAQQGT